MTKKHMVAMADELAALKLVMKDKVDWNLVLESQISLCTRFNDRFDEDKFRAYVLLKADEMAEGMNNAETG